MASDITSGRMASSTMECGLRTKCKAKEFSYGRMERSMKETLKTIRGTDMEYFCGEMERSTEVSGQMGNSTVSEYTKMSKGKSGKESGSRVRGLGGLIEQLLF